MNNVWTSIAFRAPCAARQIQHKPLLQLFNGYARSISACNGRGLSRCGSTPSVTSTKISHNGLSTTAILSARGRDRKGGMKAKSKPSSTSKPQSPRVTNTSAATSQNDNGKDRDIDIENLQLDGLEDVLTWRDYDPAGGMPLPAGELIQESINEIFESKDIDVDTGNYILSVMHWRRQSGALIDEGLEFPKDTGVSREQALKGLEFVRSLEPEFDEEAAGQVWANEETLRLQDTLRNRAVKIGLYKPDEQDVEEDSAPAESDQGTEYGRERNKDSQLMNLRERNIRKREQEEAERKARQEAEELSAFRKHRGPLELGGGVQPPTGIAKYEPGGIAIRPNSKTWLQPVGKRPDWVKRYEKEATYIHDEKPPESSLVKLLGPSFLMMLATLCAAYWASETYTPPPTSARIFPDTPPAVATVATLVGALVTGFILTRLPPLWKFSNKYMAITPLSQHALSILGATFRHQPLSHLLSNTISLVFFSLALHEDVGRGTFLAIFFASSAVGGFTALGYNIFIRNWNVYILGSSCGVLGVAAASIMVRPERKVKILGHEYPVAMWLLLLLYSGVQVMALARGLMPGIDHAGHIGGMVTGTASALWLRRKARIEREAKEGSVVEKAVQAATGG